MHTLSVLFPTFHIAAVHSTLHPILASTLASSALAIFGSVVIGSAVDPSLFNKDVAIVEENAAAARSVDRVGERGGESRKGKGEEGESASHCEGRYNGE